MRGLARVAWLVVMASCGRIGFDSSRSAPVEYVASFVAVSGNGGTTAFTAQAHAPGNAIVVQVECNNSANGATLTGAGWSFQPIGQVEHATVKSAQIMFAIAPDTAQASFTASWSTTCNGMDVLADEFTAPGTIVVDSSAATGMGSPAAALTTTSDATTISAACSSHGNLFSVASDYTKASDDTHDDWSAYRQTTDPAGTTEHVTFTNDGGDYVLTMVALAAH